MTITKSLKHEFRTTFYGSLDPFSTSSRHDWARNVDISRMRFNTISSCCERLNLNNFLTNNYKTCTLIFIDVGKPNCHINDILVHLQSFCVDI